MQGKKCDRHEHDNDDSDRQDMTPMTVPQYPPWSSSVSRSLPSSCAALVPAGHSPPGPARPATDCPPETGHHRHSQPGALSSQPRPHHQVSPLVPASPELRSQSVILNLDGMCFVSYNVFILEFFEYPIWSFYNFYCLTCYQCRIHCTSLAFILHSTSVLLTKNIYSLT